MVSVDTVDPSLVNLMTPNLWQETPLIYSPKLSENLGSCVYLKLENLHPSYSFKFRGISHFVKNAKETHGPSVHLVIASGGNAGLAAACAAHSLGVKCTVFIPEGASKSTIGLLKREKADVLVIGKHYAEALAAAKDVVKKDNQAVMVPAYDDALVWEGHSSMITEIQNQLQHRKPDAIFCSVGGGGLLGGLIVGCKRVDWDDVPLVAVETIGSDCFYRSISLNNGRFNSTNRTLPFGVDLIKDEVNDVYLAHHNSFSSRASGSLGASQPAAAVVKMALQRQGGIKSISVPDELSMEALRLFADDHKLLVELACSTTLVPAYHPSLFDKLVPPKSEKRTVVFIVCGGFKVSLADVAEYLQIEKENTKGPGEFWTVLGDDGRLFGVAKSEALHA